MFLSSDIRSGDAAVLSYARFAPALKPLLNFNHLPSPSDNHHGETVKNPDDPWPSSGFPGSAVSSMRARRMTPDTVCRPRCAYHACSRNDGCRPQPRRSSVSAQGSVPVQQAGTTLHPGSLQTLFQFAGANDANDPNPPPGNCRVDNHIDDNRLRPRQRPHAVTGPRSRPLHRPS
jgi:hypothetical protein